jgi:hypothetical protein
MSILKDDFAIARAALDSLEHDVAAGRESPDAGRAILVNVVAALRTRSGRFEPERKAGNKDRGVRYTDDEMRIIASLPEHSGSVEKAADAGAAHFTLYAITLAAALGPVSWRRPRGVDS